MTVTKRTLKRGLFTREQNVITNPSRDEWKAWSKRQKYGSALTSQNLDIMRAAARRALLDAGFPADPESDDGMEGNAAIAFDLLFHIRVLESCRKEQKTDDAVNAAILATRDWMQLRVNAFWEQDIRTHQKQRRKEKVTDAEIVAALNHHRNKKMAAAYLDISDKRLRDRIKLMTDIDPASLITTRTRGKKRK